MSVLICELLDDMNRASDEVNALELQGSKVQQRFRLRLAHWRQHHQDLHEQHGTKTVEHANRFLEADEALQVAQGRVQATLQGVAASEAAELHRAHEVEHAKALKAFEDARQSAQHWRGKVGDLKLENILPSVRLLRAHAAKLASDHRRIPLLAEQLRASKGSYGSAMAELEAISNSIHASRSQAVGAHMLEFEAACLVN